MVQFRRLVIVFLMLVGVCLWTTSTLADDIVTCDDFRYQEDAQAFFDDGGGRSEAWYHGMDADDDGIACEDNARRPFYERPGFRISAVAAIAVAVPAFIGVLWWLSKMRAADRTRDDVVLFPGRSAGEEIEDALAQLKVDRAIDVAPNDRTSGSKSS